MRDYSFIDHVCLSLDKTLRVLSGHNLAKADARANPAVHVIDAKLSVSERKHVAGLMRVNYAGEVCAQALYKGQALTARNHDITRQLEQAGLEEEDHLLWCQQRLQELDSHVSYLNPLWFSGAFLLGLLAGVAGDKWNLGFLAETERQVTAHLENHLTRLPLVDVKTHAVLETMKHEEAEHAHVAVEQGAKELPLPIKKLMGFVSKVMTTTAYWV